MISNMDFTYPKQDKLYIYNKNHQRLNYSSDLPFYFFGSSSSGNSVYLKQSKCLIDLGFGYNKYLEISPYFFYDVEYILLTHQHTDHLNVPTMLRLLKMYPHIKWLINPYMWKVITNPSLTHRFNNDKEHATELQAEVKNKFRQRFIILENQKQLNIKLVSQKNITIKPYFVSHQNVVNTGYTLTTNNGLKVLYASDLDHVFQSNPAQKQTSLPLNYGPQGQPQPLTENEKFNIMFLEANYDRDILNKVLLTDPNNAHAKGNQRHISEQETWKYLQYSLHPQGIFIPLHASKEFGTLCQDLT